MDGPSGRIAEGGRGVNRPVGVAEKFAGEEDEVGLAVFNDGVGLGGFSDEADGGGWSCGFSSDSGCKWDLKTGSDGDFGVGDLASGGNVNQVDTVFAEEGGELD